MSEFTYDRQVAEEKAAKTRQRAAAGRGPKVCDLTADELQAVVTRGVFAGAMRVAFIAGAVGLLVALLALAAGR